MNPKTTECSYNAGIAHFFFPFSAFTVFCECLLCRRLNILATIYCHFPLLPAIKYICKVSDFFFLMKTCHVGINKSFCLIILWHSCGEWGGLKFVFGDWKFSYCEGRFLYSFSRLVFVKNLFLYSLDVIPSKYGWAKLTFWYFVTELHFIILPPEITSEIVLKTGKCIR